MLSMSMMPADADPPENICVEETSTAVLNCKSAVVAGQHAILIRAHETGEKTAGCHFVVSDGNPFWRFNLDHGPEKCPNLSTIIKSNVSVRGS